MRLIDLYEEETNIEFIRDILFFLYFKNIKEIPTNTVIKELKKHGVDVNYENIYDMIRDIDFVDDVSSSKITFKQKEEPEETVKVDMDKNTVEDMARRARERRK